MRATQGTAAGFLIASLAVVSNALPVKRATSDVNNDNTAADQLVLNFALNLENAEVAFYESGLSKYSEQDFESAGLSTDVRGRIQQIYDNEKAHAQLLTEALGANASQPCNYSFSFSSPNDFVSTAGTFETVGASAYAGAMQELSIAQHVTDAASILATEARQAAYLQGQVEGFNAWNTPYETPLTMNQAWTLVSAFISSCPANNPVIFTTAFPTLVAQTNYTAGQNISIAFQSNATGQSNSTSSSYSDSTSYTSLDLSTSVGLSSSTSNSTNFTGGSGYYLAILTGLGKLYAPISYVAGDVWTAVLPEALATRGVAYGLVTNSNSSTADNATVAGMLVLKFPYNSTVAQGL